jgi:hypothetical protein
LRIHLSSSWLFHVFAANPVWQVILGLSRYPVFLNHRTHGPHGKNPLTGMSCFRVFRVFRGSLIFLVPWLSRLEPVSYVLWDWTSGHLVGS